MNLKASTTKGLFTLLGRQALRVSFLVLKHLASFARPGFARESSWGFDSGRFSHLRAARKGTQGTMIRNLVH